MTQDQITLIQLTFVFGMFQKLVKPPVTCPKEYMKQLPTSKQKLKNINTKDVMEALPAGDERSQRWVQLNRRVLDQIDKEMILNESSTFINYIVLLLLPPAYSCIYFYMPVTK